jgi:hypothetical protein
MTLRTRHLEAAVKWKEDNGNDIEEHPGMKVYLTHNNGGRPYKVAITSDEVHVYDNYSMTLLRVYQDPLHVFIGESPETDMTVFSGGHGPRFDGNSILIEFRDYKYAFIGESFYTFETDSKIRRFSSEVGNNDVPYPYGVDEEKKYYLFIEKTIVENVPDDSKFDPYGVLYGISKKQYRDVVGIVNFVGSLNPDEPYNVSYTARPRQHYNRPWMANLHATYKDGTRKPISEDEYVGLHEKIGNYFGFVPLIYTRIA